MDKTIEKVMIAMLVIGVLVLNFIVFSKPETKTVDAANSLPQGISKFYDGGYTCYWAIGYQMNGLSCVRTLLN